MKADNKIQLALFSIYAFGLQFATTIQLTNTSSLFSLLGAKGQTLANLWLSGPITGLMMGLVFGQLSDMTNTRYGKRKPYIFVSGILLILALVFLPLSQNLIQATLLLLLFYTGMNGCMWPLQAWVGDNFSRQQLPIAYAVEAIGLGAGGTLAGIVTGAIGSRHQTIHFGENFSLPFMTASFFFAAGIILLTTFLACSYLQERVESKQKTKAFTFEMLRLKVLTFLKSIYQNILYPPIFLKKIWVSQIFLWYAIYCLWVYLPLAIAEHFFGLSPGEIATLGENPQHAALLAKATHLTGQYYGIAQISGTLFTICLPLFLKKIKEGALFTLLLFLGGTSLIVSMISHSILVLYLSMIGLGALMGTFIALPLIGLTKQLSPEKRGGGLGVFNLTVTAPQILSGLTAGQIHSHLFKGHADTTILFAGILIFIAALFGAYQFFSIKKKVNNRSFLLNLRGE